jgi:hypothetical protein
VGIDQLPGASDIDGIPAVVVGSTSEDLSWVVVDTLGKSIDSNAMKTSMAETERERE